MKLTANHVEKFSLALRVKKVWQGCNPLLWHHDSVTWKAWLQEPLRFPTEGQPEKTVKKPVCVLSVGQGKPGLLIQTNTCLFCPSMSLKVWEIHRPSHRVGNRGERWDKVRNHTGSDFSDKVEKKHKPMTREGNQKEFITHFSCLPSVNPLVGLISLWGSQKPQRLNVSRPLHVWGKEVRDLPIRKISKLLHTLCAH